MKVELKRLIDKSVENIMLILERSGEPFEDREGARRGVLMDMAKFAMYLSASDGEIKTEEAMVISEYFGLNVTPQTIGDFIRENNIYSTEYESKAPLSLETTVLGDNEIFLHGLGDDVDTWASEILLEIYKGIANELSVSDGNLDENERKDANIYIKMMSDYIDQNLLPRKQAVKGFSKVTSSVAAPAKSGVTAPRKS